MPKAEKKKNNHFVPRSYLLRFSSISDKQVGLHNLKSGLIVETAPIKSQCSRDYFYTKNPIYENEFAKVEGIHNRLLQKVIDEEYVPPLGSLEHHDLLVFIMFQAARTATTAAHQDNLADQFGRAIMRKHYELDGNKEMRDFVDTMRLSVPDGVMEAIGENLAMWPLIADLDITLIENHSDEDFLTSDHPIALCNSLPADASPYGANVGFASRGLLIIVPLSPRFILLLSDREVYKVTKDGRQMVKIRKVRDAVELNLAQCFNAYENLYFASSAKVKKTLAAFNKRQKALRPGPAILTETSASMPGGRRGVIFEISAPNRRMILPSAVEVRYAVRTGRYSIGNAFVRDPNRVRAVRAELDRLQKLREHAAKVTESEEQASS